MSLVATCDPDEQAGCFGYFLQTAAGVGLEALASETLPNTDSRTMTATMTKKVTSRIFFQFQRIEIPLNVGLA
jgi:hypothetical protein